MTETEVVAIDPVIVGKTTARERIVDETRHPKPSVAEQMPSLLPGLIALILALAVAISIVVLSAKADDLGGPPTYVLATVFGVVVGAVAVYLGLSQRR